MKQKLFITKQITLTPRFYAALGLALLAIGSGAPTAAATGTIGCHQTVQTHRS